MTMVTTACLSWDVGFKKPRSLLFILLVGAWDSLKINHLNLSYNIMKQRQGSRDRILGFLFLLSDSIEEEVCCVFQPASGCCAHPKAG